MSASVRREGDPGRSGQAQLLQRDQFGELPEVLGRCGEVELVPGPVRSPQPEPIQLQDALEVGKQHLDLLALAPRGAALLRGTDIARHLPGPFVDRAQDLASRGVRAALQLQRAGTAVALAGAVAHHAIVIDERERRPVDPLAWPQRFAGRAGVGIGFRVVGEG